MQLEKLGKENIIEVDEIDGQSSLRVAKRIGRVIENTTQREIEWIGIDGLPINYPFDYEKDIIKAYTQGKGSLEDKYVRSGCTKHWPKLEELGERFNENPLPNDAIGSYRDSQVLPVTLSDYYKDHKYNPLTLGLTFAEAGPRENHYYSPQNDALFKVGIVVSGGIAPGINAVISGIVKRQFLYADGGDYRFQILGYSEGFKPFIYGDDRPNYELLASRSRNADGVPFRNFSRNFDKMAEEGGSILPSSRFIELDEKADPVERDKLLTSIVQRINHDGIDILYVIGGDGSMKAAHAIRCYARNQGVNVSIVAIPNTMDNDILWVWQSLGFQSAVEWAKGAIRQMFSEVKANPRAGVIQLFGSDSGFVVNHETLASGVCDLALTPEINYTMPAIIEHVKSVLETRFSPGHTGAKSPFCIILMSENAIPEDASNYIDNNDLNLSEAEKQAVIEFEKSGRRVLGKTSNDLRTAGLKIVSTILQQGIQDSPSEYWQNFEVVTSEPRHLIRSVPPSSSDIIFGERLGTLAVDCAMAGYSDFMISQWLTEYVMVPLKLVVMGRKRVPTEGIFWKSVIAKTGQPANLNV